MVGCASTMAWFGCGFEDASSLTRFRGVTIVSTSCIRTVQYSSSCIRMDNDKRLLDVALVGGLL